MKLKKSDILMSLRTNEVNEAILIRRLLRQSLRSFLAMTIVGYLCALVGCGYTARAILPDNVKTIHVDIFKNSIDITKEVSAKDKYEIYRPNLEVDLRDAMVERIFLDGHLKVMSKNQADAVLEGEIIQFRKDPLRYQNEEITEYRISLVCDVKLVNSKNTDILFEENGVTGDVTYFTTGSLQKTETQALTDAMQDLARRVVNKIVENW